MNNSTYQLLLLDESEEDYQQLNTYLGQLNEINNSHYKLNWVSPISAENMGIFATKYDAYLVDSQLLPSLSRHTISQLTQRADPAPVIILTENYEFGMIATEAGAADYLDKTHLSLPLLERSLRLTLAYSSLQQQINSSNQSTREGKFEALYAGIFNHSANGIFLIKVEPDGKFVYETANPVYAQITGRNQGNIVGKTIAEVLPSEIAALVERQCRACLVAKQPISYEHILERQEIRIWHTVLIPIENSAGQIIKLQGSARDITEEKRVLARQIRQTRYRHLLRSVTLKIRQSLDIDEILQTTVIELQKTLNVERVLLFQFLPDGSGKVVKEAVVRSVPAMMGRVIVNECYRERLHQQYVEGYVHACSDIERARLSPCYRAFLRQYQIRANLVLPVFHRQPTSSDCTADDQNYLWGLLCVQQCRQPRKWSEDEIELLQQLVEQLNIALSQAELIAELLAKETKQRQELARSNAELEQFAYIASHDLQAPLQTISNYVQLLQRRYHSQLDPKADKYIYHILGATQRMQTQINDLLEYSRVGKQKSTFRLVDFNSLVEQAIANLRSDIEQTRAKIIRTGNLPTLVADSSQLIVLFQNLISNSLKYRSEQTPVIKIYGKDKGDSWQFAVSDNGIGIEPRYQKRIFQIFQRLHTQEEYPGTGMGLAICQKIVACHGGQIWVDSQLGQGAIFYFSLPL